MAREAVQGDLVANLYRLDAFLGKGGMGVVWAATHLESGRAVALKMLQGQALARVDLRRRLLREARAAMSIDHENVVRVHEVFETTDDETPVVVMDLLEGESLGARLRREEKLSLSETARILLAVVAAVSAAHERGIVHRDLKPDNIFLAKGPNGTVDIKVLDFGIAKLIAAEGDAHESGTLTGTGTLLGTPCYMAPEQGFGEKDIDSRADVWALGVILYECLSGGRPVEGENLGQVLKRLLREGITPLRRVVPGVPPEVARLVDLMLVSERERRLNDLDQVAQVLRRWATPSEAPVAASIGPEAKPRWFLRAFVFALAALVSTSLVARTLLRHFSPDARRGAMTKSAAPLLRAAPTAAPAPEALPEPAPRPGVGATPAPEARVAGVQQPHAPKTRPATTRSREGEAAPSEHPTAAASGATILGGLASRPPF